MRCELCGESAEDDSYWVQFEGDRDETPTCEDCYERLLKHLEAETSSDLDCSYCGISGSDREGEPLCSRCLGCFECCESLHDEGKHQDFEAEAKLNGHAKVYGINIVTGKKLEMIVGQLLYQINEETLNMAEENWYLDERMRDQEWQYMKEDGYFDAEGETPIMPPMGFGESVNWTPHDGTPSLRRDRRRSEGDYSPWDYGEPPCPICVSEVGNEDANAADEYCEVCDMSLCVGCFNDKSHDCIRFNTEDYWDGRITDYGEGQTGGLNKNQFGYSETGLLKPTRSTMPSGPKKVKMVDCMRCGQPEFADELIEESFCRKCGKELSEAETFEAPKTAYSMIEHQDDWCLKSIVEQLIEPMFPNKRFWSDTYWDINDRGDMIVTVYPDGDPNTQRLEPLAEFTFSRQGMAEALKAVGYKNPESWGSETIRFNSASDAYALAYSQGHAHGRRQQPYDPKLSKEEREVFTGAWKIR